jgi:hypothetical protein
MYGKRREERGEDERRASHLGEEKGLTLIENENIRVSRLTVNSSAVVKYASKR